MAGKFLNLFRPVAKIIPEIKTPTRRVSFNEKLFWTALALIIYLIMSEVPLYGIEKTALGELAALRVIFASSRGSLMELGIGPIVTGGLILQLLAGSAIIDCDMSRSEDRGLFSIASKVFAIVLTGAQALAYIMGGVFGTLQGPTAVIVLLQLLSAGFVVLLLDELIQKGWGLGSGISLFIMAGVAQHIFWQCLATVPALGELRSYGFFTALAQVLSSGQSISVMWLRENPQNPSMLGFIATIVAFIIIIYVEGVRVELPLSYAGYKGFRSRYPIKLLYVSNLPVIFASALFADVYLVSQVLWSMNGRPVPGQNFWLDLLGQFTPIMGENNAITGYEPSGGLVYYVTSPRNFVSVIEHPLKALGYLSILVAFCILFSLTWLEVGGLGPSTVSSQLVDAGMQIPGYRRSRRAIETILRRYIPAVTVLGGIVVGLIAGLSDFFGVFGSGMGILLSVGIIYQYYEILMKEKTAEMYPAFRRLFGG